MINRELNYGRHLIGEFVNDISTIASVLDLGAGYGGDLQCVRKAHPRASYFAVESNPDKVAALRRDGIETFALDAERDVLPLGDESVDLIIANQFLEHVRDVYWVLHEASRVLKPGGHLLVGVPNLASLHNRILLGLGRQPSSMKVHSAHIRGFTRRGMEKLFDACFPGGYALDGFGGSNFYPFPPAIARPLAAVLPNLAWGIFFRFRKQASYSREFLSYLEREDLETPFYTGVS